MYKLDLEKAEKSEIKLPTLIGSQKKQGNYRKTSTFASLTTLKPLTLCITKTVKILKEVGVLFRLTQLLRNLYASKSGKLNSDCKTGKGRFSFQSQRKAMQSMFIALISYAGKEMLKILQARLQQYVNHELLDVQAVFRKGRGTRGDQIANICWITVKARKFQKNIYFCFIDYAKTFDCVDHNKL